MQKATEKQNWVRAVKSKPKALGLHFIVDTVLKIEETFYKQADSMWYDDPPPSHL